MVKRIKFVLLSVFLASLLLGATTGCAPSDTEEPTDPVVPPRPKPVPVVPNDSIVTGTVMALRSLAEVYPQTWEIVIEVQSSQDVPGYANLTKEKIGETIVVVTQENAENLQIGQVITAHVEMVGDEYTRFYRARNIS